MPTDQTWVHLIDALGPVLAILLLIVVAAIVSAAYIVVSNQPHKREVQLRELDIQAQREKRKADEARMRDEEAVRNAELRTREIANSEHIAQVLEGQQVQMAAIAARFDESADRSRHMGETVEDTNDVVKDTNEKATDTNEKVTAIMPKIDEVHELLLRSRD